MCDETACTVQLPIRTLGGIPSQLMDCPFTSLSSRTPGGILTATALASVLVLPNRAMAAYSSVIGDRATDLFQAARMAAYYIYDACTDSSRPRTWRHNPWRQTRPWRSL
ncbi:MAG: hypothetical protein M0Z50_11655 [Planctomycetia bacterium]|nr:hypothetical protein [Planctomycetia bacterium]